jgi:hypothetical protein
MEVSCLYNCLGFFHSLSVHIMVNLINTFLVGVYKYINCLFNTFAAIVDLIRFNNSCLKLLKISDDNNE